MLGAGDDVFQWDPGEAATWSKARTASTRCCSTAANASENFDIVANGGRVRFLRDVANITMDLDDVETIRLDALGGADNIVVGDLTGHRRDQGRPSTWPQWIGGKPATAQLDSVTVNATNGGDVVTIASVGKQIVIERPCGAGDHRSCRRDRSSGGQWPRRR